MNFYQSVFLEKTFFLENIRKNVGFWGNYLFSFSDQSFDSKNYFLKFRLYRQQICGVTKKSKTF